MRALRLWFLKFREASLLGQIEHGEALVLQHRASLQAAYAALRRVRSQQALITPARQMVSEAMRRRAT